MTSPSRPVRQGGTYPKRTPQRAVTSFLCELRELGYYVGLETCALSHGLPRGDLSVGPRSRSGCPTAGASDLGGFILA
jgi:hypothetical protein